MYFVRFVNGIMLTVVYTAGLAVAIAILHMDNLRDDEYYKDEALQAWVGSRSKRRLQLGAHVRVIVTAVNPVEGLIDLDLVPELPASGERKAKPE